MPTQIQLRRGTYDQHKTFTGANAEPTFDTSHKVMRLHDGTTPGGSEIVMGNSQYKSLPVRVISTSNITLSGVQTVDGVSLSVGDRVLVAGQTDQSKNGIYTVVDLPGTWVRSYDFDKIYNIQKGMFVYVAEGSTHNETVWKLTSQPTTLDLHAITFEKWLGVETRGIAQNTVAGLVVRQSKGTFTSRAITVSGQGITVTNGDGISGNPLLSLNSTPNNTASTIMARDASGDFASNNATLAGDIAVNGGDVTTTATTATLFNTNATTLNIGNAATTVSIGAATGTTTVRNDLVVNGTFTVNGTTQTINAVTVTVDDKNIELGSVASPSNTTADGGGITLKGTTDKTINWINATGAWTSSEDFSLATGKTYEINAIPVLTSNSVLNDSSQTSITVGGSATTITMGASGGTTTLRSSTLVGSDTTQNVYNTVATTINAFGAAGTLNLGANVTSAQTTNIGTGATASATTKTLNLATGGLTGSTTNVNVGSTAGGLLTINNPNVTFNNGIVSFTNTTDATTSSNGSVRFAGGISVVKNIVCDGTFSIFGDISVNGGDILTNQTTVSVFNDTATTASLLGAASTIAMGASGGTTTLRSGTLVGTDTTQNVYNTTATTVNAFGAASTLNIGAAGGTTTLRSSTLVGTQTTQNLFNTTATTLNMGGAATTVSIGASSGNTTVNNNLIVSGNLTVNGTTTTINSTITSVDDIEFELGSVASPTDVTANGGGIRLKGTTDKTINWSSIGWTSSEDFNLVAGKVYEINGTSVLSATTLGSGVVNSSLQTLGTITTGVWNGTTIAIANGGTGATTAQGARTNLLPPQSAPQNGYVLTTNGSDVFWNYLGNAMVTSFNGRTNVVTLTAGDVNGALGYTAFNAANATSANTANMVVARDGSGNFSAGTITASAFQVSSDIRIKTNVVDSQYGLDTVLALRSVTYIKDNKQEVGLIAQEVEKVLPEFVGEQENGMKTVNYGQMVSVLIKAVQELTAEVEQLKAKIKE